MKIGSSNLVFNKKNKLPLISHEEIYEKINKCHMAVAHSGRHKTWSQVVLFVFLFINPYRQFTEIKCRYADIP
jgi:hypothetical protein